MPTTCENPQRIDANLHDAYGFVEICNPGYSHVADKILGVSNFYKKILRGGAIGADLLFPTESASRFAFPISVCQILTEASILLEKEAYDTADTPACSDMSDICVFL